MGMVIELSVLGQIHVRSMVPAKPRPSLISHGIPVADTDISSALSIILNFGSPLGLVFEIAAQI